MKTTKFQQLIDVCCREFKMVIHGGGVLLFLLFLPLAYPIIYSLIYNPEIVRDVEMVVVDNDRSALSRQLVRSLDATQEIRVVGYASNLDEGKHAMHSHECFGLLLVPDGFSEKINRGEQADAVLFSDMSLLLRYRAFLVAATNVAMEMGSNIQFDKAASLGSNSPVSSSDIMPVSSVYMGNITAGFDSFVMPGVVILILHQCIILAIGMVGGAYREKLRNRIPIAKVTDSVTVSMLGRTLCYFTLILVPMLFLVYYVPLIFSFPMAGNIFEILLFLLPMVLSCIFFGFCFQTIVYERESVFILWVATSIMILFLSGLTWPRYAMSPLWQAVGNVLPATWGIDGYVKMNTTGASLSQVSEEYVMLWILAIGYALIAYLLHSKLKHRIS